MLHTKSYRVSSAFGYAFAGLHYFFRHERNGRIQAAMGFLTLLAGLILDIAPSEWMIILLCIGAVLSAEMINSALEKLCDHVQPSLHPQIKIIKDVAAGGVLMISAISGIIGLVIFLPKIWQL